jgi:hypothetical protein
LTLTTLLRRRLNHESVEIEVYGIPVESRTPPAVTDETIK